MEEKQELTKKCLTCGTENSINDKYCKECGRTFSGKIFKQLCGIKHPLPFITEIIISLIIAIIFALIAIYKVIADTRLFAKKLGEEGNTIFQQIFCNQEILNSKIDVICFFTIAFIGAMFTFCIWSVYNYNRIKKELATIQELIIKGQK